MFFIAIVSFITIAAWNDPDSRTTIILLNILDLFFVLGFFLLIYRAFIRKVALIVDDKGITDNSSFISPGLMKWEDIMDIFLVNMAGINHLGIKLKDEDKRIAKSNPISKFF